MDPTAGFGIVAGLVGVMFVVVPLFMAAIIGLGIYAAVKAHGAAKLRRAAIDATVVAHRLGHVAEDPARTTFFSSPPFGIGDNQRARDIVWGTLGGRPFETFAYSYETQSTDSEGRRRTTTHSYQITWVPLPAPLPTVRITSDNALLRALTRVGMRDLKVESHEFNQRWKVWCADERAGHALLTPRMIERLLAADVAGRAFVFEGRALMSYADEVSDLAELPLVVGALNDLVDRIPAFMLEEPGAAPAGP